jgi:hypothetical protein
MAINTIVDNWSKKQRQLISVALDANIEAGTLLTKLQTLYPDIYKACNAEKLNKICNDWQQIVFSRDGECHE